MRSFRIQQTGYRDTDFRRPMFFTALVFRKRKEYRKAVRKAGGPKDATSEACFHGFSKVRKDGQVGQMFIMADATLNTITHECFHAAIRMAHNHFGSYVVLSIDDVEAEQEEAIAYLTADLTEALHATLE